MYFSGMWDVIGLGLHSFSFEFISKTAIFVRYMTCYAHSTKRWDLILSKTIQQSHNRSCRQVAYAWPFPWSTGTVLFFLNRYLPFIDTFLSLKRRSVPTCSLLIADKKVNSQIDREFARGTQLIMRCQLQGAHRDGRCLHRPVRLIIPPLPVRVISQLELDGFSISHLMLIIGANNRAYCYRDYPL